MRAKGKNPFPGVIRIVDRHGKVRWRFRMKGRPNCYLFGEYGSAEFIAAYELAASGDNAATATPRFKYGTFDWLIEQYYRGPVWRKLAAITKSDLRGELERFRKITVRGALQTFAPFMSKPSSRRNQIRLLQRTSS